MVQVCALFVSSSSPSPCLMRTPGGSLRLLLSLSFSSTSSASSISFCHFTFREVVDYNMRTAAEEPGPDYNNNSSTSYEPNDNDDITIGQTLLNACRRRGDHSEEEGLSSCLSSSSISHDRTEKPVDCRDASHAQGHEIQRQNFESEQIRTLLDRQREQILADCQAETRRTSSCSSRRTPSTRSSTSS